MQFPNARILIFTKAPRPGQVKTRLIPALGERAAADLHGRQLRAMVSRAVESSLAPVECWCAPDNSDPFFHELWGQYRVDLRTQRGADLGERMFHAAQHALENVDRVLLIGADCPVLTTAHLARALDWLADEADAVLGPAEDGGYVLLGLRRVDESLFRGIPWGEQQVAELTRERMRTLGWSWRELETLWDVDRPADLERLRAEPGWAAVSAVG